MNDDNEAVRFLRKAIITFFIIILILLSCFTVLYVLHDVKSFKFLMYLYIIQHIMLLMTFLYFKNMPNETMIRIYLAYIPVTLFPIACICWNSEVELVFFWYLIIILGAIIFDKENIKLWISVILITVISVFLISSIFPREDFTPEFVRRESIMTIISSIILASFFAIVYSKIVSINALMQDELTSEADEKTENLERDKALYEEIVKYLEDNKPFKNPDFNAHALAKALNTNVTYISKAIKAGGTGNFNVLISNFRIDYIKSMLDNGALKKYTIDYIYAEGGYRYRSTFNAAFKNATGMTPSDYISHKNNNKNS